MHLYDPDGQVAQYRRERVRKDNYTALLFAIGCVCFVVVAVCAYLIIHMPAVQN